MWAETRNVMSFGAEVETDTEFWLSCITDTLPSPKV